VADKKQTIRMPLLGRPTGSQPENLTDLMWVMAANIEDSIMASSSAVGGKDYTVMDLYKLAAPFALKVWERAPEVSFDTSWPDYTGEDDEF
jgi:hypothetical protein